jgi:hypothetical protein
MSSGLLEVEDELMWCSRVDTDANVIHVVIRGMYGTTAAAHTAGALVRNAPRFPRFSIKRAINDTIRSTYPALFTVDTTEITYSATIATYALPADTEDVLDVVWATSDGSELWEPVRYYSINLNANTTAFPTGRTIDITQGLLPGRTVQVVYRKRPVVLANGDDFTDSGLEDSAKECIVYGACARLVGYIEPARMSNTAAEAKLLDAVQPAGVALSAARYFYQMHRLMLDEESRRLLDRYPPRIHFQR